jgi:hypothetical protein
MGVLSSAVLEIEGEKTNVEAFLPGLTVSNQLPYLYELGFNLLQVGENTFVGEVTEQVKAMDLFVESAEEMEAGYRLRLCDVSQRKFVCPEVAYDLDVVEGRVTVHTARGQSALRTSCLVESFATTT